MKINEHPYDNIPFADPLTLGQRVELRKDSVMESFLNGYELFIQRCIKERMAHEPYNGHSEISISPRHYAYHVALEGNSSELGQIIEKFIKGVSDLRHSIYAKLRTFGYDVGISFDTSGDTHVSIKW